MAEELQKLMVDTISEMRELKGELREFKDHVFGRITRLEANEKQRHRDVYIIISLLISAGAFALNVFARLPFGR
jgi:hypothetical protein